MLSRQTCSPPTNLGILYPKHARRQCQRDQRGGEQHLEAGDIALTRLRLLVERVRCIYAVAVGGTWVAIRASMRISGSIAYRRLDGCGPG